MRESVWSFGHKLPWVIIPAFVREAVLLKDGRNFLTIILLCSSVLIELISCGNYHPRDNWYHLQLLYVRGS